jgi:homogentisate 1,2-dioxygenase
MARLIANDTVTMCVTAPAAPMDYFFEHHAATLVFFVHRGRGALETPFGPLGYGPGDFLIVPKGITHRFDLGPGPHYYWVYESRAGDPQKSEAPTTGRFIPFSRSDLKYPRSLETRNEAGRFPIVAKVDGACTRRVHPTHPFDVVGWRGDYLPYKLAVEDVRPLLADRSHVPPSGHTVFALPGCYLCVFTVRRVEREGLWLPFFHRNLDYCETIGYHSGQFFSRGGVFREGMVSVHPVGLPHGPHPAALDALLDGRRPELFEEVGIMADFANPARISDFALGLSRPDYMASWAAYATAPRHGWSATRLAEVERTALDLAGERDRLRPVAPDEPDGAA